MLQSQETIRVRLTFLKISFQELQMDKSITSNQSDVNHGGIAEQNKNADLSGNVFRPRSTGSWSAFSGVGNLVPFPKAASRRKTFSESSETSSIGEGMEAAGSASNIGSSSRISEPPEQKNLTFGNSNQVVYDIDGKFPYTYYENKPTLYDVDGAHRYKYFKAFKATPYTEAAPHHEKRPWIYDPADGRVMCLTAKDLQNGKK